MPSYERRDDNELQTVSAYSPHVGLKYLCVCKFGHCRSVAACRLLHRQYREAVACGWLTAPSALWFLSAWWDRVILLDNEITVEDVLRTLPRDESRIIQVDIGPDKWRSPYDDELIELLKPIIQLVIENENTLPMARLMLKGKVN